MASDVRTITSGSGVQSAIQSTFRIARITGRLPGFEWSSRFAHWTLRIPLAGIMLVYGIQKYPDMFISPGGYGVPAALFILAALAELLGPVALVIGGIIETVRPKQAWLRLSGDALTRAGAFAGVSAAMGVIIFFYWGAITIADPQILMLGLALFLLFRGNLYRRNAA